MKPITFSVVTAIFFGFWQKSIDAGLFMFVLMGFVLSCIDYYFYKIEEEKYE